MALALSAYVDYLDSPEVLTRSSFVILVSCITTLAFCALAFTTFNSDVVLKSDTSKTHKLGKLKLNKSSSKVVADTDKNFTLVLLE